MPSLTGTPGIWQSPYPLYRLPSGAQVGVHESHPLVLATCFISDLASQTIEPDRVCKLASDEPSVWAVFGPVPPSPHPAATSTAPTSGLATQACLRIVEPSSQQR